MSWEVLNALWKQWKPGEGRQPHAVTISIEKLEAKDKIHFAEGLRLENLQLKNNHYFAVWRPGTGGQHWQGGMSEADFKKVSHDQAKAGRRLHCLSFDDGYLAAVWRDGSGEQQWEIGVPHDELKNRDDKWAERGLRIQSISVDAGLVACCWRPGTGRYRWVTNTSADELRKLDTECTKQGLSMTQLAVDDDGLFNTTGNFTALWQSPQVPTAWGIGLVPSDFAETVSKMNDEKSFLLVSLAGWQAASAVGKQPPPEDPALFPDAVLDHLVFHN